MKIFVAGLSYKTAPVELREQLALSPARLRCGACRVKIAGDLSEAVVLSTCNRVEIYGVAPRLTGNIRRLFSQFSPAADVAPHTYLYEDAEAVRHLFSVASGLDSMVLGETQITGQVKQAYQAAHEVKLTGRVTNRMFQTALQTAKEVRTNTQIGQGAVSVGSVAVELAEKIFDHDLSEKTVMILGAGKMGEACVRHLAKRGAQSVLVSNRSFDRAQRLAGEIGGTAIRFDDCFSAMVNADIVVTSTGCPQTILHRQNIEPILPARRNRPLFLIDIAVPRNIDPEVQLLENVYLYNIDHLEALVRENLRLREQELARCQAIIDQRTESLMARFTPVPENNHELRVQPQLGWIFNGSAACHS